MVRRTITAILAAAIACITPFDATALPGAAEPEVIFAVTGNTNPESPFVGFTESLPELVDALNRENPLFVLHTGNIVRGGEDRVGIIEKDVSRQFSLFLESAMRLSMPLYTAAGALDLHNGSTEIYTRRLGRPLDYSFNYDRIHIVVLNTVAVENPARSRDRQMKWLADDLERNGKRGMTIVVTHDRLFSPVRGEAPFEGAEIIHQALNKHGVAAVISGSSASFFTLTKDSVTYINAGCGGFNSSERCYSCAQYYLVSFKNGSVRAMPKYLKIK
ncbi:MAG TPA: metallophosphoesterase [Spirochaetota bacterium]|nr:metallophosphoesterase [Spirochaetota bacterium]HSA14395.1 metallophosphoesterase [Spirochaetota bacterium]